jgi:hypothetical protein
LAQDPGVGHPDVTVVVDHEHQRERLMGESVPPSRRRDGTRARFRETRRQLFLPPAKPPGDS